MISATTPGSVRSSGSALAMMVSSGLWAAELPSSEKDFFHLFHPTPRNAMRELSTDRPDKTESAYTVDAGHFQVELDAFALAHDTDRSGNTAESNFLNLNLKLGLLSQVDLQVLVPVYNVIRTTGSGTSRTDDGFGDIETRLKINLWGNDGGTTALAVMPFAKWPTASQAIAPNQEIEGGLIVPLAIHLPRGFDLGLMTEIDFARNNSGSGYHAEFVNSITLGHDLIGNLGAYLEFWSLVSDGGDPWQGSVDIGFTYGLGSNTQFDWGVNLGITRSAPDFQPFVGFSWRY